MTAQDTGIAQAVVGEAFGELRKNWGWLLALGVVSVILGTIGLGMASFLTIASVIFFGALLVFAGILQLADALKCRGWKSVLWHVLIGLLYVAGGAVAMIDPVGAAGALTLVLAGVLIAVGVIRIIMAWQVRPARGWIWTLLAGIVSIVLAWMILAQWPVTGLWVIGLFVAIELIFNGWSYIFIALAARSAAKGGAQGGARA